MASTSLCTSDLTSITVRGRDLVNELVGEMSFTEMLYFLSAADGYRCLYAQRLHSLTKRPQGESFGVYHLHNLERRLFASWAIPFNFAVTRNRVYLTIVREQSNIWMLDQ